MPSYIKHSELSDFQHGCHGIHLENLLLLPPPKQKVVFAHVHTCKMLFTKKIAKIVQMKLALSLVSCFAF